MDIAGYLCPIDTRGIVVGFLVSTVETLRIQEYHPFCRRRRYAWRAFFSKLMLVKA